MGKRTNTTTQEYLENAILPEATDTYTVIPHGTIIKKVKEVIEGMGFEIERELYRCNNDAQIAQGIYHLKYGDDPDIGMMFAWSNSYNKIIRFNCCVGGYVHESLSSIISGNMGSYGRKHTGTADTESLNTIDTQLLNAEEYFKTLLMHKEQMKSSIITAKIRAEILGRFYFNHDLLTNEQLSVIRQELIKPTHLINAESNTLWYLYHAIIYAMQRSHPKTWMAQQSIMHELIEHEFMLTSSENLGFLKVVDEEIVSNQIDMLDVIAEVEAEQNGEPAPWEDEANTAEIQAMFDEPLEIRVAQENVVGLEEELVPGTVIELFLPLVGENDSVDDLGWPCISCNKMQDANAVWNDEQLCSRCADASMITNINLDL
jgi:hypothetical protein